LLSWPDNAPPVGSGFARHGQDLRISVQISRRRGGAPAASNATPAGQTAPLGCLHSQLLGKRYRLCHNWRNEIVARAE
jgi:hypothetical protein